VAATESAKSAANAAAVATEESKLAALESK